MTTVVNLPREFTSGTLKIKVEKSDLDQFGILSNASEKGVFQIECKQKGGVKSEFVVKPSSDTIVFFRLQSSELQRTLEALGKKGLKDKSAKAELITMLFKNLGLKQSIDVDKSQVPKRFLAPIDCYQKLISVAELSRPINITISAAKDLVLGGETFPEGDIIAFFGLTLPVGYQFTLRLKKDFACCKNPKKLETELIFGPNVENVIFKTANPESSDKDDGDDGDDGEGDSQKQ